MLFKENTGVAVLALLLGWLGTCALALAGPDYRLGAGDMIKISVFESPALFGEERVSESGAINLPLIGKLEVAGLTVDETALLIAGGLEQAGLVRQAHVSVQVSLFNSRQVTVIGQVNKPGRYVLDKSSSLVDLISMAGGIANTGGYKAILISHSDGGEQKREIDLDALLKQTSGGNIEVGNGDIIYVPDAEVFYIYGEVQKPGRIKLERNMTVLHAISAAGGLTPKGNEDGTRLKRPGEQGGIAERDADLAERVKADDILYVPEGWF